MLTNTLLLYMTQEALAKARDKLTARDGDATRQNDSHATSEQQSWRRSRSRSAELRVPLRH